MYINLNNVVVIVHNSTSALPYLLYYIKSFSFLFDEYKKQTVKTVF